MIQIFKIDNIIQKRILGLWFLWSYFKNFKNVLNGYFWKKNVIYFIQTILTGYTLQAKQVNLKINII